MSLPFFVRALASGYTLALVCGRAYGMMWATANVEGGTSMNWKGKLVVGILTALVMFFLTFALPRGGPVRDAALAQFPMTVGVWAIFVLLYVKLK
jgi:hypothetical protein